MYFHPNGSCYSDEEMRMVEVESKISALRSEVQRNNFLISGGPCPRKGNESQWHGGVLVACCGICGKEYEKVKSEEAGAYMGPGGVYRYTLITGIHP